MYSRNVIARRSQPTKQSNGKIASSFLLAMTWLVFIFSGCGNTFIPLVQIRDQITEISRTTKNAETCHEQMHEFGHQAFDQYGLSALDASDESCNGGYIHGVIESALGQTSDPIGLMKMLCDEKDTATFSGWECVHGIGHGLMAYTENDLPVALSLCQELSDASVCVNGVWMENFIAEEEYHPTEWRKKNESFFPCEEGLLGRTDCYLYAPVWYLETNMHDYTKAMNWCRGAGDYQATCVQGVGSQAMKDNYDQLDEVVLVCDASSDGFRDACIRGMTGMLVFHNASIDEAVDWCSKRSDADQEVCQNTIKSLGAMFE